MSLLALLLIPLFADLSPQPVDSESCLVRDHKEPKLVAPPGRAVESRWIKYPDPTCKGGQRDVLRVTVSGRFYIGALEHYLAVGQLCPGTQFANATRVSGIFFQHFPKDGDAVTTQYGTHPICKRSDARPPEPVPFDGTCVGAPPSGSSLRYTTQLSVGKEGANLRSSAVFAREEKNLLGKLPPGALLQAEGPLKNAQFSDGVGWGVLLMDKDRRICRGYVSDSVVMR